MWMGALPVGMASVIAEPEWLACETDERGAGMPVVAWTQDEATATMVTLARTRAFSGTTDEHTSLNVPRALSP
jgi:hypothetical protein